MKTSHKINTTKEHSRKLQHCYVFLGGYAVIFQGDSGSMYCFEQFIRLSLELPHPLELPM